MRQFKRWLRKPWRRVSSAVFVGVVLGCASVPITSLPVLEKFWIAVSVAMSISLILMYAATVILYLSRPIEPFGDGEIGILLDSDRAAAFERLIVRLATATPLAGRLAFRTTDDPLTLPVDQPAKGEIWKVTKARLIVHENERGQVRLIVLDGPSAQSKSRPFVFYAEIYEWLLSRRDVESVGCFVVAYILYRREFYEGLMAMAPQLGSSPEALFLQGCTGLRMSDSLAGKQSGAPDFDRLISQFELARESWGRWLFPDSWAATTHNLGIVCLRIDPRRAIDFFSAAGELRSLDKYPSGWAYTNNNLALALALVGRREEAIRLLREARDTLAKISYTTDADLVQQNLLALDEPDSAKKPPAKASTIPAEVEAARAQIRQLIGIPNGPFVRSGIHIAHRLLQATTISGDFYKIIPRQDGSVGITLVDVEGHGLAASATALAVEKALFRAGANWGRGDAREQLIAADALISDELGHAAGAVTMNFLEVDPYAKVVRYAGAGMPFPLLFRFGQSQPEVLTAVGMYVGDGYRRVRVTPNRTEVRVGDGDLVLMFTDGITEARDQRGRVFGQNGITAAVIGANRESPEAVADAVLAAALQHGGSDQPEDDQALLVIQIGTPTQVLANGLLTLSQVEIGPGVLAFELTNASDSGQYLGNLRSALMTWAAPYLPVERRRQEVYSCLVEAIQNALRYGCGVGEVIGIEFRPSLPLPGVEIVVSQPKRWEDWDISLGTRRPSQELTPRGVGTLTMLRLANEVTVTDQGRRVHLRFYSGGPDPGGRLPDSDPLAELRLRSPQDLNIRIRLHEGEHGIRGLVANLINDRSTNLSNCMIIVRDAKSFDARRQTYREIFGMQARRVAYYRDVLAGDQTTDSWLVRIAGDRLELGDHLGEGVLFWPKGDPAESEVWLLTLYIEAGGLDPWIFDLRVAWSRGSNVLQVYPFETP